MFLSIVTPHVKILQNDSPKVNLFFSIGSGLSVRYTKGIKMGMLFQVCSWESGLQVIYTKEEELL